MASCPATRSAAARSAGTDTLAAVANHGTIMHQLKAAVSEVVQRRDSAFADHRACENDRVPQTPLWELADASTLFSAVAALRPGRASVFHDRASAFVPTFAYTCLGVVLPTIVSPGAISTEIELGSPLISNRNGRMD